MGDKRFFAHISDIRDTAPLQLEEILHDPLITQKGDRLVFTYWVNMEPHDDRPLLVDRKGQFWIGKPAEYGNLIFEEYGKNISQFLGCPSPEVNYYDSNGVPLVLSRFIHPSNIPSREELKNRGQIMLVPRLLATYSHGIERDGRILFDRLNCDVNFGQFLIDSNGVFYQIDFSPASDRTFSLDYIKGQLSLLELTASQSNEVIVRQLAQLEQCGFEELYQRFTPISSQVMPEKVQKYLPMFAWNFKNVGCLLHLLQMSEGHKPARIVIH